MPHNNSNALTERPDVLTRPKLEGGRRFVMSTPCQPAGDQPTAIVELTQGVNAGERDQVLLGATGTGKTFTMAKVIEETQRPAIILAPNKTLAAQLYGEFKGFFPDNAVEYFVSYYDYYQPEAYVPSSDTYIEKDSSVNDHIEQMRLSATKALMEREDVLVVATVSAIYGLGTPQEYVDRMVRLRVGEERDRDTERDRDEHRDDRRDDGRPQQVHDPEARLGASGHPLPRGEEVDVVVEQGGDGLDDQEGPDEGDEGDDEQPRPRRGSTEDPVRQPTGPRGVPGERFPPVRAGQFVDGRVAGDAGAHRSILSTRVRGGAEDRPHPW